MTTKAKQTQAIAAMVNQLQAGLKADKAKQTKASKPVITLSIAEQVKIATEAGNAARTMLTARDKFTECAKQLHDAKVVIGDARKCKVAQAFIAARFEGNAKVAASSKANALAAFRYAVQTGKAYDENRARKEKQQVKKGASHDAKIAKQAEVANDDAEETTSKKGKTDIGAAETATTYQCTIARKGSAKKAAQTLRDLINKMRDAEEYSPLCALIIDALDEFEGTAE